MDKDIQPIDPDSVHSPLVKQSSNTDASPLNTSIIEQFSNPLQLSLYSPLKKRPEDCSEGPEMKNYPAKMNVCKGLSTNNIMAYANNTGSSPVVQYYAGIINSPSKNKPGHFSPEVPYVKGEKMSHFNPSLPNQSYNCSPSTIFNNMSQKKSSDSSIAAESNGSSTQTPKQTPFMSKSLQEKIEGNFNMQNKPSLNLNENDTIKLKSSNYSVSSSESKSSGEENRELYMLSFNSDEEGEQNEGHPHHLYPKDLKERETKEKANKLLIKNKFDEVSGNSTHKHKKLLNIPYKEEPSLPPDKLSPYYQDQSRFYHDNPQMAYYEVYNPPKDDLSNVPTYLDYQIMTGQRPKRIRRLDPITYIDQPYDVLAKNLYALTIDQGGCRYLQKIMEQDPVHVTNALYPPLIEFIVEVVVNPFGNYLIQKLFGYLNESQMEEVMTILSPHILDIGANSHGTRVIQQMINHLSTPKLISAFVKIILPFVIPLLNELNGTHIIQKFCAVYPQEAQNIYTIIIDNCLSLATHRHGCCVLQKYLESLHSHLKKNLIDKLISNCLLLIIDQFGNYVIQSILYLKDIKLSNTIADKLLENVCYYSKHKYSSNVVEKCFDYCDNSIRAKLIEVLSKPEVINDLILDEHGNYVVQKVLACTDYKTQTALLQGIIPLFSKINELPFGEHIISRLVISYPQLSNKANGGDSKTKPIRGGGGAYFKRGGGSYYNGRQNNEDDSQYWGKDYKSYGGGGGGGYNSNRNYRGGYNSSMQQQKYK